MLEKFKHMYDMYYGWRLVTWFSIAGVALLLFWTEGGFPPRAWKLLAQSVQRFPTLWSADRSGILLPLVVVTLLSLVWGIAWGLLLWTFFTMLKYHRGQRERQRQRLAWIAAKELPYLDAFALPNKNILVRNSTTPSSKLWQKESEVQFPPPRVTLPYKIPSVILDEASRQSRHKTARDSQVLREQRVESNPRSLLVSVRPTTSTAIEEMSTRPERSPIRSSVAVVPKTQTVLEVGVGWHTGLTRKQRPNEDNLVVLRGTCTFNERLVPFGLFIVADGMGGHDLGQEASRLAIQMMMQTVLHSVMTGTLDDTLLVELLVKGVELTNHAIHHRGKELNKDMGTTLTAALVVEMKAYIVNVGDSRTYLLGERENLLQVTRDHSLVASLVAAGSITPDEVYTHPDRNKVYRSLGTQGGVAVDWFTRELRAGDNLLLCSDGLWEMVRDPEIERLLKSNREPTEVCTMLVQAALEGGGTDNVSVIVVRVA